MAYTTTRRRAPARRKRKTTARRKRTNPRFGRHRPVLIYGAGGWRRPRRKLKSGRRKIRSVVAPKKRSVRINRRRRRRMNPYVSYTPVVRRYRRRRPARRITRRRRVYRRNPDIMSVLTSRKVIMTGVKIGGGMVAGALAMPVVNSIVPEENREKWRPYYGAFHVLIGALVYGFVRNRNIKDVGLVIAGTGVYDLIASNVPQLGLPQLPVEAPQFMANMLPGNGNGNGNGNGGVSASYRSLRSGYGASYPVPLAPVSPAARAGMLGANYYSSRGSQGYNRSAVTMSGSGDWEENPYSDIEF